MNKQQTASQHFSSGLNCAQSVLLAFLDELGINEEQAIRFASGFGGGIAKNGHVCGAVSGAVMVIGMKFADGNSSEEANAATYAKLAEFLEKFRKEHKTIMCRDIIDGLDLNNPADREEWKKRNLHDEICLPVVQTAVKLTETL